MGFAHPSPAIAYLVSDGCWIVSNIYALKAKRAESSLTEKTERILQWERNAASIKRLAGWSGLTAIGLFINSAHNHHQPQVGLLAASMIPGMVQTLSIIAEMDLHRLSERWEKKDDYRKVFAMAAKYPILTSTIPDLLGTMGVIHSALQGPHPLKMLMAIALWTAGDLATTLQDSNFVKSLDASKTFSQRKLS